MAKAVKKAETAAVQSGTAASKKNTEVVSTKTVEKETATKKAAAKKIADELGVDTLFENTQGEYFTDHNRALLSVGGNAKKVFTHKFADAEVIETVINELLDKRLDGATGTGSTEFKDPADNPNRHQITEQDLLDYPILKEQGHAIGDFIEALPDKTGTADASE